MDLYLLNIYDTIRPWTPARAGAATGGATGGYRNGGTYIDEINNHI